MIQTSGIFTGGGEGGKYKPYLTFRSAYPFVVGVDTPGWDGTVEMSTDAETWETWAGYSEVSGTNTEDGYEYLYLRGTGNTTMMSSDVTDPTGLTVTGYDVCCIGSVETLLDYQTVDAGGHPAMAAGCFRTFFKGCPIVTPPDLSATTLSERCYIAMFQNCTKLAIAPELPATTLMNRCYYSMFSNCSSLVLPPQLPATELAQMCYMTMFANCTSLIGIPILKANTLYLSCYNNMFNGCAKIKLSSTEVDEYSKSYRIPFDGTGVVEEPPALGGMFGETGGTFAGTPAINTTYYVSDNNIVV